MNANETRVLETDVKALEGVDFLLCGELDPIDTGEPDGPASGKNSGLPFKDPGALGRALPNSGLR